MRRLVFIVGLLLVLLPGGAARGEPAQDTTLTLQEAIDAALAQHPTLRVGQATVEAARTRQPLPRPVRVRATRRAGRYDPDKRADTINSPTSAPLSG